MFLLYILCTNLSLVASTLPSSFSSGWDATASQLAVTLGSRNIYFQPDVASWLKFNDALLWNSRRHHGTRIDVGYLCIIINNLEYIFLPNKGQHETAQQL